MRCAPAPAPAPAPAAPCQAPPFAHGFDPAPPTPCQAPPPPPFPHWFAPATASAPAAPCQAPLPFAQAFAAAPAPVPPPLAQAFAPAAPPPCPATSPFAQAFPPAPPAGKAFCFCCRRVRRRCLLGSLSDCAAKDWIPRWTAGENVPVMPDRVNRSEKLTTTVSAPRATILRKLFVHRVSHGPCIRHKGRAFVLCILLVSADVRRDLERDEVAAFKNAVVNQHS